MNWEAMTALGTLVLALAVGVGAIGSFYTTRAKADAHDKRLDEQDDRLEKAESKTALIAADMAAYKLRVAETYVNRDNLDATEDRLTKRLETVEHTVRNTASQIIGALSGRNGARKVQE